MSRLFKLVFTIFLFVFGMVSARTEDAVMFDALSRQNGTASLERLSRERVTMRFQALQQELSRRNTIRYGAYGFLGAAGVGLVSYALYQHFAQDQAPGVPPQPSPELNQAQQAAIAAAQQQAMQRYYDALEQQKTFSGHVKRGAWYGAELAIGTFVAGLILSSFAKGQEAVGSLLPGVFASDQSDYERLYRLLKRDFTSLREALMVFDVQEQTGQHEVSSDVLYGYFCGEIVADYSALVYRLESLIAFLMVYCKYHKLENFDAICRGADALELRVDELATSIELVLNRAEQRSLAAGAMHFRDCYVYAMKFICSCGEALYGDAFCPE